MKSFEEIKEAFKKQVEFFVRWHHMNINSFEYVAREILPNRSSPRRWRAAWKRART
jgi:formate C-acetyltransferase